MKKLSTVTITTIALMVGHALLGTACAESAQEEPAPVATLTVTAASAYVFRGATINDRAVLQPSLEATPLEGLALGVWTNLDLDHKERGRGDFSEVDLYATYTVEAGPLSLGLTYTEYLYPNTGARADREVAVTVEWPVPVTPSLTAARGVGGAIDQSWYYEGWLTASAELAEGWTLSGGGSVAYVSPDEGTDGWSHYTLKLELAYAFATVGVRYIGRIDRDVLADGAYDKKWVASLSLTHSF